MTDSFDVDKIVAAILAAAKVSQGGDQSNEKYARIYGEMYKAVSDQQVGEGAAVMRGYQGSIRRQDDNA